MELFGEIPEPLRSILNTQYEAQAHQSELHDMAQESFSLSFKSILTEVKPEHLVTVRLLLRTLAGDTSGRTAAYYDGMIASALALFHNVCSDCGEDHGKLSLQEETAAPQESRDNESTT
jgi:hypothetical protein